MFLAVLIQNGIGVVNVYENFATFGIVGELRQQAVASRERKMAHFASRLLAAPDFSQFIVGPESTVQECDITGRSGFQAFRGTFCQARRVAKRLSWLFETQRHHGFLCGETAAQLGADEVGIIAAKRRGGADKGWRSGWIVPKAARQAGAGSEVLPLYRRICGMQNVDNAGSCFNVFLYCGWGADE